MVPQLSEGSIDHVTAIGSYYIAAAGLLLTIAALLATGIGFYFSMKHSSALKSVEVDQKKFENALELIRIVTGVKDRNPDGSVSTFLQVAALESLRNYPDYHDLYLYMRDYYKGIAQNGEPERRIYEASVRLVKHVEAGRRLNG